LSSPARFPFTPSLWRKSDEERWEKNLINIISFFHIFVCLSDERIDWLWGERGREVLRGMTIGKKKEPKIFNKQEVGEVAIELPKEKEKEKRLKKERRRKRARIQKLGSKSNREIHKRQLRGMIWEICMKEREEEEEKREKRGRGREQVKKEKWEIWKRDEDGRERERQTREKNNKTQERWEKPTQKWTKKKKRKKKKERRR
jgi:hypothetical protein